MSDDNIKKPLGGGSKGDGGKLGSPKSVGGSARPAPQPSKAPSSKPPVPGKEITSSSNFGTPQPEATPPLKPMSGPKMTGAVGTPSGNPAADINTEQLLQTVNALQSRFNQFLNRVNFSNFERRITDITNQVTSLPADITAIRSRGYAFRSFLENKAQALAQQWQEAQDRIQHTIRSESQALRQELEQAEPLVQRLSAQVGNAVGQSQLVPTVQTALDSLEAKVSAAENLIEGMCASLERELQQTRSQLDEINTILERKEDASFDFYPAESVFLVAEAEWTDDRDTPNGLLFLTDQRLVFEQKETTGKTLGLFGGKAVQEMRWEAPLSAIESVEAENKGFLGGKDMLNFTLGAGAPYPRISVELKGGVDCKFWARQIRRMMSGDAQDERAIEPDPELLERLRNAPTACHICGGTLPQIAAGQHSLTCRYCGVIIRI